MATDVKDGQLQFEGDETTIRPFGRAVYLGEADYFVLPRELHCCVHGRCENCDCWNPYSSTFGFHFTWQLAICTASRRRNDSMTISAIPWVNFIVTLLGFFFFTHLLRLFLWLFVELGAKWGYMGRREEGRYNYDTSDYCQNWETLSITCAGTQPRENEFYGLHRWHSLHCRLFPTLWLYHWEGLLVCTPRELTHSCPSPTSSTWEIGVSLTAPSVVCHLNTRGNFELAKITLGNHVTLRTSSRIQQGVQMESGSMLLEKSLAMTGEVIEADSVWQGAPASLLFTYDFSTMQPSVSFSTRNTSPVGEPIPLMLRQTHSV